MRIGAWSDFFVRTDGKFKQFKGNYFGFANNIENSFVVKISGECCNQACCNDERVMHTWLQF